MKQPGPDSDSTPDNDGRLFNVDSLPLSPDRQTELDKRVGRAGCGCNGNLPGLDGLPGVFMDSTVRVEEVPSDKGQDTTVIILN